MAVGNGYVTGSADPAFYQNQVKALLQDPSSFAKTPGYQFTRDQSLDALNRQNSTIRGSGNAVAALLDRASGLASTGYNGYLQTLGGLTGQEENYDLGLAGANNTAQGNANTLSLGTAANANTATRNANDLTLGLGENANTATRNANDLTLGMGANANTAQRNANDFGLGTLRAGNDLELGQEQNANNAQNNWWNYNLGQGRNATDYYDAQTRRGDAQTRGYLGNQQNLRDWYSVFPRQRVAGQP